MDTMVRNAMAIEREVDVAQNIQDVGVVEDKMKDSQPYSSSSRKKHRTSIP